MTLALPDERRVVVELLDRTQAVLHTLQEGHAAKFDDGVIGGSAVRFVARFNFSVDQRGDIEAFVRVAVIHRLEDLADVGTQVHRRRVGLTVEDGVDVRILG